MSECQNIHQKVIEYLEENRPRYLADIRELARIPAPSNHEEQRAIWCKQYLESLGATGVVIDDALNVIFPYHVPASATTPPTLSLSWRWLPWRLL